ncbi:MAG: hypothetical protein IPK59_20100 [Rhodospirillaceae bacterium]|nr:hypothetical protein [Rhodospirillaceae bacterium]
MESVEDERRAELQERLGMSMSAALRSVMNRRLFLQALPNWMTSGQAKVRSF